MGRSFNLAEDRIVTTSPDKTIRLWDAATGNELANLRGHIDLANMARFSRSGDRIITAGQDKTARIWDAASPSDVSILRVPGGAVNFAGNDMEYAAFSPAGDRILNSSADEGARVWDAATGRMLLVIDAPANASSRGAFDPSGERIVITTDFAAVRPKRDVRARVFDARTGRELLSLQGHEQYITSVAFSPTGDRIVTASADRYCPGMGRRHRPRVGGFSRAHTGPGSASRRQRSARTVTASSPRATIRPRECGMPPRAGKLPSCAGMIGG